MSIAGIISAVIVTLIVLAVIGVAGVVLAAWAHSARHKRAPLPRRIPACITAPDDALLDGDPGGDALAMVCRLCTTGHGRCSCAGHCGRQSCRGGRIHTDLSGALLRITQERDHA
jgi:hypothetical protein